MITPAPKNFRVHRLIGPTSETYLKKAELIAFKKKGVLMLPAVSENMLRISQILQREKAKELRHIVATEDTSDDSNLLSAARGVFKSEQRLKGGFFHYCGFGGAASYFKRMPYIRVECEVQVGNRRYDMCLLPTNPEEDWRVDIEFAMSVRAPKFESELWRHHGDPFYLVCTGYDLTPRILEELLDNNCQPVVTVGSPSSGVISFDKMLRDIKEAIIEIRQGVTAVA